MRKGFAIAEAFALMAVLQALKLLGEHALDPLLPDGSFPRRMVTAGIMAALSGAVCLYARWRRTPLSVFPRPFGKRYVLFTCAAAALWITSPANYSGGVQPILLALYGSVITPVYEELLFRGYLWNRLEKTLDKEISVSLWSIALFTIWHLGYMLSQLLSGNWTAVLWKLAAGAGYGAVLGLLRLKTKNCYATMLLHGVLNIFMI